MGEAIISRGFSGSSGSSNGSNNKFRTEIITSNTLWRIPDDATGDVSVRIFGGGGGGGNYGGGGGGYMNNAIINSNELKSKEIYIVIGSGGANKNGTYSATSGGTSSFGTYLSAFGGGGGGGNNGEGGSGGSGGGGNIGGTGYQFGGGGAGGGNCIGGNGGRWGGGGATSHSKKISYGGCLYENSNNSSEITGYSKLGGNSGNATVNAENGTNTIGMGLDFEGSGESGCYIEDFLNNSQTTSSNKTYSAGGGYGGCGGISTNRSKVLGSIYGGGGGGYGANGGNGGTTGSGGGGGYGGKGGDGSQIYKYGDGGGGGYGKCGNGGGYDKINNCMVQAGIAAGGYGYTNSVVGAGCGGSGICIIQYYVK